MATVKTKPKTTATKLKAGKKKKVNKWLLVAGVASMVAIGVLVVRYSSASTYTFINYSSKMSGGAENKKSDGNTYRVVDGRKGQTVKSAVSAAQMANTNTVCAHFKMIDNGVPKGLGNYSAISLVMYDKKGAVVDSTGRISLSTVAKTGQTGNVCLPVWGSSQKRQASNGGTVEVSSYTSGYGSSRAVFGVDTVYGKPTKLAY